MIIPNFSNYELLDDGTIINISTKEALKEHIRSGRKQCTVKMKNDNGIWVRITKRKIKYLINGLNIPSDFKEIPYHKSYFINKNGEIISTTSYSLGNKLKIIYPKNKYAIVNVDGKNIEVHKLLALTFIDKDYLKKGLCVLHLDNNKHNHSLSNLKVGTYSENIKQAYADGLNKGNGLKKCI